MYFNVKVDISFLSSTYFCLYQSL